MKEMKIYGILFIFLLIPFTCSAQLLSIGAQTTAPKGDGNIVQFAANASYPVYKNRALRSYIASGIDYTGGSSPVAGLNVKPIQFTSYLNESLFNNHSFTFLVACDAGYLFNFRHGKDGVIITPNAYFDYKGVFVKTGYDFNVTEGEHQFFVRLGINFGIGTFKNFVKTKIW